MQGINLNDKLPKFIEINQDGEVITHEKFFGKKLIIFFFPKANTKGCTDEVCNLSYNYNLIKEKGFEILGISIDSIEQQKKFHEKFNVPYDFISDENKQICKIFGVWKLKKIMGKEFMGVVRTTFIFDENSICTKIIDKVKTKYHSEQILHLK